MPAGNKCAAPADLRAGADDYKAVLEENCDQLVESQECFAESAAKLNTAVDALSAIGKKTTSDGNTVDYWFDGKITEAASLKIGSAPKEGSYEKGDKLDSKLGQDMIRWQVGQESTGEAVSRFGEAAKIPQRTNAGRFQANKLFGRSMGNAQVAEEVRHFESSEYDSEDTTKQPTLKEMGTHEIQKMEERGVPQSDIALMREAIRASIKVGNTISEPGLTSCAEKYDEIEIKLQKASGRGAGTAVAHSGGDPAARAAAAAALLDQRDPATRTVFVDSEIEYKEQCILLSQIVPLAKYHRELTINPGPKQARLPYYKKEGNLRVGNAPLIVDGEAYGFINRLTQTEAYKDLFNMSNADISALQPMIRLFKVIETDDSIVEHEIAFDSFASDKYGDITDIFKNKARRGFGVGIKSFNLTFDGQDMFAASRTIKATLKLQANSFDEFLQWRISNPRTSKETPIPYRYIELALKTGGKDIDKYAVFPDDLRFRLKAVFGWNPNVKNVSISSAALNESFVSINLTPVTHNFDFDEQGRVTFTIEYYAYIEELLSKPSLNVFTEPSVFSKILARQIAYNSLELEASCDTSSEEMSEEQKTEREKEDAKTVEKEKICMINHMMSQLFREDKIYILKLNREQLRRLVKEGPFFKFDSDQVQSPSKDEAQSMSDDLSKMWDGFKEDADKQTSVIEKNLVSEPFVKAVQIPYLYIGDVIDIVMGEMTSFLETTRAIVAESKDYEGIPYHPELKSAELQQLSAIIKQYKKFRLTMGPLELYDHAKQKYVNVNFADVPISVAQFSEFLTSKLLQKDQAIYPLTQFLKDIFNLLIKNYLNKTTCKGVNIKQKTRLFESCVTSYGMDHGKDRYMDRITHRIVQQMQNFDTGPRLFVTNDRKAVSILNISGKAQYKNPNEGFEKEFNHFVFYAGRVQPSNMMKGDQSQDEARGIFHYILGKNEGIVKNIQLTKTNSPGLKEVRFESEGHKGLHQLREIYDVEIDSYANVRAFPGTYIFVEPRGFAPNLAAYGKDFDLTDLGIGGYYMIIRSSHEFAAGVANTKLTAVWVHSKNSQVKNKTINSAAGKNDNVKGKCNAKRKKMGLYESAAATGLDESTFLTEKKEDTVSANPDK